MKDEGIRLEEERVVLVLRADGCETVEEGIQLLVAERLAYRLLLPKRSMCFPSNQSYDFMFLPIILLSLYRHLP